MTDLSNTNSLGMVETKGLVGAIEAADAMVKAATGEDPPAVAAVRRSRAKRSGCRK